jgi:hypothetical protein
VVTLSLVHPLGSVTEATLLETCVPPPLGPGVVVTVVVGGAVVAELVGGEVVAELVGGEVVAELVGGEVVAELVGGEVVAELVGGEVVGVVVVGVGTVVVEPPPPATVETGVGPIGLWWISFGTRIPAPTAKINSTTTPTIKPALPLFCNVAGRYWPPPDGQGAPPGAW